MQRALVRTLIELGAELKPDETDPQVILDAAVANATDLKTVRFKRDDNGLYVESRQVKAAFKESANCLWAGDQDWGKTRKGAKNFIAEHLFIKEERIYLGVTEPSAVELHIAHVKGPKGPQSSLNYVEVVTHPLVSFTVQVDALAEGELSKATNKLTKESISRWSQIWQHMQENGLGAMRAQDYGKFDVVKWEKV